MTLVALQFLLLRLAVFVPSLGLPTLLFVLAKKNMSLVKVIARTMDPILKDAYINKIYKNFFQNTK